MKQLMEMSEETAVRLVTQACLRNPSDPEIPEMISKAAFLLAQATRLRQSALTDKTLDDPPDLPLDVMADQMKALAAFAATLADGPVKTATQKAVVDLNNLIGSGLASAQRVRSQLTDTVDA